MEEDELELWHSVQYRMNNEGIDYCFIHYSNWDEIKDEEFHRLRLGFLASMKELREYVSKSISICENEIERKRDLEDDELENNIEVRDTMDEVSEMMKKPMNTLPDIATEYLRDLSSRVGFCGEVCVTAYAYYCQAVLKMKCDDSLYKITDKELEWFKNKNYC